MKNPSFQLDKLSLSIDGKMLLNELSTNISGQGCTVIIGPNGAGKTTLLRAMHGLYKPSYGKVLAAHPNEMSYVFQTPKLLARTVEANLTFAIKLDNTPKTQARQRAVATLKELGLSHLSGRHSGQLSVGERQMVALARGLATQPKCLLLDEPTANLDGASTRAIEQIITQAKADQVKIILVTHSMTQAKRLAEDVIFMHQGAIFEHGAASEFFKKPETLEAQAFINGEIV